MTLSPDRLLREVDELLRTLPTVEQLATREPDILAWRGRFIATMRHVSLPMGVGAATDVALLGTPYQHNLGVSSIVTRLHEARHSFVMQLPEPDTKVIAGHMPYDYFEALRSIISSATTDLFLVDAYLDADVIRIYMPHVAPAVSVRLLCSMYAAKVESARSMYVAQKPLNIEARKAASPIHDRFIFIDNQRCYQSGASFKDGGRKAPAAIVPIIDGFSAMRDTYEALWSAGTVLT